MPIWVNHPIANDSRLPGNNTGAFGCDIVGFFRNKTFVITELSIFIQSFGVLSLAVCCIVNIDKPSVFFWHIFDDVYACIIRTAKFMTLTVVAGQGRIS